jgi:predicted ATPase
MSASSQGRSTLSTDVSLIEEIRLTSFKSFRDATLPFGDLTLLVGRNGSGKSNALDGLWALSRLASGDDIRDVLDGGRDGPAIRGGVEGCAPLGSSAFTLGCRVLTGDQRVDVDLTIQTVPDVQILAENLRLNDELLLATAEPDPRSSDIKALWGRQPNRQQLLRFRRSAALFMQVLSRIPATDEGRRLHLAAAQVTTALRQVFVLDPVPHLMRQYVRAGDTELRRNADNLSAAVSELIREGHNRTRIVEALNMLNEHTVVDLDSTTTQLGDVMLTLQERTGSRTEQLPIRLASDGTLRFLAVLTALLQAPTLDTAPEPLAADDAEGQTTMVIEELENGLHASQARTVIGLIREEVEQRRIRTLATVHSPAVLDALTGTEHANVIVCFRDAEGASRLSRLVDLPDYFRVVASGSLGKAVTQDRLRPTAVAATTASSFIDELLGGVG